MDAENMSPMGELARLAEVGMFAVTSAFLYFSLTQSLRALLKRLE